MVGLAAREGQTPLSVGNCAMARHYPALCRVAGKDRFVFFGGVFWEEEVVATLCGEGKKSVGMWPVV